MRKSRRSVATCVRIFGRALLWQAAPLLGLLHWVAWVLFSVAEALPSRYLAFEEVS